MKGRFDVGQARLPRDASRALHLKDPRVIVLLEIGRLSRLVPSAACPARRRESELCALLRPLDCLLLLDGAVGAPLQIRLKPDVLRAKGEDTEQPNTFHFYEKYEGRGGFEAHTQTEHFADWEVFAATDPFTEPPVVSFYEEM